MGDWLKLKTVLKVVRMGLLTFADKFNGEKITTFFLKCNFKDPCTHVLTGIIRLIVVVLLLWVSQPSAL